MNAEPLFVVSTEKIRACCWEKIKDESRRPEGSFIRTTQQSFRLMVSLSTMKTQREKKTVNTDCVGRLDES